MNYRIPIILLILLTPTVSFSQKRAAFSSVDSFALTVRYKKDLTALTTELTKPFSEPLFKARSIFRWITENIRYDYKYYNKYNYKGKEPKPFKCKDDKDCDAKRMAWETKYMDKVLQRRKAVCQGYSMLFKKMCDIAGLRSEIVPGYVRTEPFQVGTAGSLDHAWNVIWLDSAYYLLDATWAAGGCVKNDNGKLLYFQKNFNNYYWLTPAADFARDHYPQTGKWALLPNYTKDSFAANPYYLQDQIAHIQLLSPATGIITAKVGDTIRFKLTYDGYFKDLQINSNIFHNPDIWTYDQVSKRRKVRRLDTLAIKKQRYVKYELKDNVYEFEYVVTDRSLYYLDILFDRRRLMRFKVNVGKEEL